MSKLFRFQRPLAALGALLVSSFLLAGPAQAATGLQVTDVYSPLKIMRIDIAMPQATVDSLNNPDKKIRETYVPATFSMTDEKTQNTSGSLEMTIRRKGSTSNEKWTDPPSYKIKFKKGPTGTGFLGLRKMTLNGLIQDNSKIHEFGAYALFNAMGIPASKTGWARVYVNGVDGGLFLNVEQPDQVFMAKRFRDVTQHIYEGVARQDFNLNNDNGDNNSGAFLADYGWKVTPNKNDLLNLIYTTYGWGPKDKEWWTDLDKVTDRTELVKFLATEVFLGHWDGYSGPNINNYYIRSNTRGKFSFIPWGVDQTFGENRKSEKLGDTFQVPLLAELANYPWDLRMNYRGKLYTQCILNTYCKKEYLIQLKAVSAKATAIKLGTQMAAAAKLIDPVLKAQYSSTENKPLYALAKSEQTRSIGYIAKRQAQVAAVLKKPVVK